VGIALLGFPALGISQGDEPQPAHSRTAHSTGADWHLKGEGVVCCPCAVPCPCRTNGSATYGHCEATLYLHVGEGHYGAVRLNNLNVVDTSGPCGMSYQKLSAIYLDRGIPLGVQEAFLQLLASFSVSIPEILDMAVDRNWGQAAPPFPPYAAQDRFANALQYAQNLRYRMHDEGAKLHFDYSRRQANYRSIDLDASDYRERRMIVQYLDGSGWFNAGMLRIINEQHLLLPDLEAIGRELTRLRQARGASQ